MKILYVTMSGCNETTDIKELATLLRHYPHAEIGIQVSPLKCSADSERMKWIKSLAQYLRCHRQTINAALHINPSWVGDFMQGYIAPELKTLLEMRNNAGYPFFQRLQLNFLVGREEAPKVDVFTTLMKMYPNQRFILPYNQNNEAFIRELYQRYTEDTRLQFSSEAFCILYDSSHGEGVVPKERPASVFNDIVQGYAGGISSENVAKVLDQIVEQDTLVPNFSGITIDAEGKLKNEKGVFDLERARAYLSAATKWINKHTFMQSCGVVEE